MDLENWEETSYEEKRRMERELASKERELATLRREREWREEERQILFAKSRRLAGGSRFNIRYESSLTAGDKTPESVMAALSEYLYFPTETSGVPSAAAQKSKR